MISTEEGIQIDESDEQSRNAAFPMCESSDSFSKLTSDKVSHSQKQFSQMISTDEGIQIDESE
jgi:hypothetical protein